MKVISMITPVSYGGGENLIIALAKEFGLLGIDHTVLNLVKSEEFEKALEEKGLKYYTLTNIKLGFSPERKDYAKLFFKLLPYIIFSTKLKKLIGDPDIIMAHGFPSNFVICLITALGKLSEGKRIIHVRHSIKSPMNGLPKLIYGKVLKKFDAIIGVSSNVSNSIMRVFPELRGKIITIPNGIDLERFALSTSKEELRDRLSLPLTDILAIYVARFSSGKNHIFLLDVLDAIPRDDFKLILLGNGQEYEKFISQARSRGLEKRIICPGFIPNSLVPFYIGASDFYLHPSVSEGLSICIVEAMASGLPVVIFKSVYMEEFGKNILVAEDEREFIWYVSKLIDNRKYVEKIGFECKKDAQRLSIKNTAMMYVKFFEKLSENRI